MELAKKQWFLYIGDQNVGPLDEAEIHRRLSAGQINQETHVWCEGMADWKKLGEVNTFAVRRNRPVVERANSNDLSAMIELGDAREPTAVIDINKVRKEVRQAERPSRAKLWGILAILFVISAFFFFAHRAHADEPQRAQPSGSEGERMSVENLKHKYWAQGEEEELRVVQNRRYSKASKLEIGLMGGFVNSDPFLSIHSLGGSLGFYTSEYFAIDLLGWKYFTSNSSAQNTLQQTKNTTANTNPQQSFYGAGVKWSPLYGKLSLLGESIIYYDIYLTGGLGTTKTQSGSDVTPFAGIGSQIYLSRSSMLQLTFYQMYYQETVQDSQTGTPVQTRTNWPTNVMIGFNFLLF